MEFCKAYNDLTKDKMGQIVPVEITAYVDASFTLKLKTPPAADLIRKKANKDKGASSPGRETVGQISMADVREIAEIKMPDLNAFDLEAADNIIIGSARSMGIEVVQ